MKTLMNYAALKPKLSSVFNHEYRMDFNASDKRDMSNYIESLISNGLLLELERMKKQSYLIPQYMKFNVGESKRGRYLGFFDVQVLDKDDFKEKKLSVCLFINNEGFWMNGGVALKEFVSLHIKEGEAVEIALVKKKATKTPENEVNIFSVKKLKHV